MVRPKTEASRNTPKLVFAAPADIVNILYGMGVIAAVKTAKKLYLLNDMLTLKINLLPDPGIIVLDARVLWIPDEKLQPQLYPGMGVEFYKIDSETQKKIIDFIERNIDTRSF